jgi:hypothetical protein
MADNLVDLVNQIKAWERVEALHVKKLRQARAVLYRLRFKASALPLEMKICR